MRGTFSSKFSFGRITVFGVLAILIFSCNPYPEQVPEYGWFEFVVKDLDTAETEINLSFLNQDMAGKNGFIKVQDGHFIDGTGENIRFFGTNFTFSSCFPDKEVAQKLAARLSKMGMNVVRFHHMDMRQSPSGIWDESMENFDADQVDKLDWLIYQLKLHGVYTNLNLHVSRTYPGLETEVSQFQFGKTIDHFYRPYIDMQKDYARDLLSHVNPYTGTNYLEEPAVAFIEINNENSLLSNWKQLVLLEGDHRASLLKQWNAWLSSNAEGEELPDLYSIIRGYEDDSTPQQKEFFWKFLVKTEMDYTSELIGYVRNELKAQSLIADSQGSYSGIAGVFREATYSDFMDMHAYWEHPSFPGASWSSTNWLIRNSSMVSDKKAGTLSRFGQHRVAGMPLTISEYDHPAPNFYCAEMYPMLNAVASFQDWDGIYHFTFNSPWDKGRISGFFSSAGHPLKQIFIPVGSVIFRMNAIKPGKHRVHLNLSKDKLFDELVESGHTLRLHGSNMNYIWEKAGAPRALTLLHPMEVNIQGNDVSLSEPIAEPDGAWISETGELQWNNMDSVESVFTINSEMVKAAVGYIGSKEISLGNVTVAMDSTPYNWGTIVLTSLDGKPVEKSSKILLVAAGRVENTNMGWDENYKTVGSEWGEAPTVAEGIPARISIEKTVPFKAFTLDPSGNISEEIRVNRSWRKRTIVIGAQHKTLWYLLKR